MKINSDYILEVKIIWAEYFLLFLNTLNKGAYYDGLFKKTPATNPTNPTNSSHMLLNGLLLNLFKGQINPPAAIELIPLAKKTIPASTWFSDIVTPPPSVTKAPHNTTIIPQGCLNPLSWDLTLVSGIPGIRFVAAGSHSVCWPQ
jgi:hypothetical protein